MHEIPKLDFIFIERIRNVQTMTCLLDQTIYFVLLNTRKTWEIAHVTHTYDVVIHCI